jgi:hypothetical protein
MAACGECKYLGWLGLTRYCRHPDHVAPLTKWPGKCPDFVDLEMKCMPGHEPKWPLPVDLSTGV